MIKIRCVNRECPASDRIFEIDENEFGADGPAKQGEKGARQYIVVCPFCNTENLIWMKEGSISQRGSYATDVILVRKESQDFR